MIKQIVLKNFRLFDNLKLETNNSLVILSGLNATGKTSILEAIYLASTTKSHRINDLEHVILNDKDFSSLEITALKKIKMVISKNGKSLFINNQEIKKNSDFIGNINVILSSPYDINLIKGSKGDKRHFLDLEISLLDKSYLKASTAYKKILRERNDLLKTTNIDLVLLDVLTKQLISFLEIIYKKRIDFIDKINQILVNISKDLDVENIKLEYKPTYEDNIYSSFKVKEKADLLVKVTNIGTHRDDFIVYINNLDASIYASEGQIKTICVALKLAVCEYMKNIYNIKPILLLDDVYATLDKKRIQSLTKYVLNMNQTFITTTSILEIPDEILKKSLVIRIDNKKGDSSDGK